MKAASRENRLAFSLLRRPSPLVVDDREAFWSLLWDFCGIVGDKGELVLVDGDKMPAPPSSLTQR